MVGRVGWQAVSTPNRSNSETLHEEHASVRMLGVAHVLENRDKGVQNKNVHVS